MERSPLLTVATFLFLDIKLASIFLLVLQSSGVYGTLKIGLRERNHKIATILSTVIGFRL